MTSPRMPGCVFCGSTLDYTACAFHQHVPDPRSVAVKRTLPRWTLHRWTWTPVIDGGHRTREGGFALTRRGAIRKGRRWHREDERVRQHIYAPTEYAPAGSDHA